MKRAFLDLKDKELTVYFGEKNGFSPESLTVPVEEGYAFGAMRRNGTPVESVLSLPLGLLDFRIVEMPFSDTKKIRELLPFEIDGLVLGGAGSVVFDAVVLGKKGVNNRILVAYLPKDTLRAVLAGLRTRGFDPAVITCVELSRILATARSAEQTAELLSSPAPFSAEERMNAALAELEHPAINLRQDEFAYSADTDKMKKSLKVTAFVVSLLVIVFLSDLTMTLFSARRESAKIRDDMRKTYAGVFPGEKKITSELYQMKAHIKELKEKEGVFAGVSPLQTLLDLSRTARPGLSLSELTLDRQTVVLKGECPTMSDVQKFRNDLGGIFGDVVVSDTKPSSQNRTLFTITAKVKKA